MDTVFEAVFHLLFKLFRFLFIDLIFEIIFEGLIRSIGYGVVRCYRLGQPVDFDSTEVFVVGFITLLILIFLCIYWFLLR
ncbi:hypothetical protein NDN11_17780 [Acinetobacter sp. C26M]|uniref:hypothetical protein n=1 Tax=unclassified Acinetobacter TaxID=196816 RepID=UPI001423F87B|nr:MULTISPECIES: hypothetical protein [unclassified Acinetobacter]NIE98117.1 hypothetical protein [Acinetobacter sp. Tr-809]USA46500.1 hypothetical protein NDN11_17780 [Acinetobacter sp. C26M]USA49984.1 hypothetical protein NDN12_17695 [Acinetobacter sp. C26G]